MRSARVSSKQPLAALGAILAMLAASSHAEEALQPRASIDSAVAPFAAAYCIDCHSGEDAEAGLAIDRLLTAPSAAHRRREWQRVVERLEAGEMPPEDFPQPELEERQAVLDWLAAELAEPDCSQPHEPGRVTLRRLNRVEYQNTVRDLLGVEFDAAAIFPRDELGFGFDNNADVQTLSAVLLEKYLAAAEQIAAQAIVAPESILEPAQTIPWGELHGGSSAAPGWRGLYTRGRLWAEARAEQPGQYLMRVRAYASQAGDQPARIRLFAGDQTFRTVDVLADEADPQTFVALFDAKPGPLAAGVEFVNDYYDPDASDPNQRDRNVYVASVSIIGPLAELAPTNLPESHRRVVSWTPAPADWNDDKTWRQPTRELIGRLLVRAFRRPPTAEEIERLVELVDQARQRGDSYQRAIQLALEATLVSPQFLFRGEASRGEPGSVRDLDEYELASRLSYFLWSSMPDETLLRLAAAGKLRDQLDAQLDRMLASPEADQLIRNFGEQWLETRSLETLQRNAELFPEFSDAVRDALRQETFLLLADVFRSDRPLTTLFSADYSFINRALATHYGLPEPAGDDFVRVELPPERRAGVLAHGSVLAVTSHDDRTSPVLRGKWVLNRLLADAPPPPPPGVAALPDAEGEHAGQSLRQRLEIHRADPSCAVCHDRMDPLGLAMENFDATGRWRTLDGEHQIDAHGQLPDGRELDGVAGLRDVLLEDFARVRRCLAENLLTYALGRGLEPADACTLADITAAAESGGDTFSSMVRAIVHSSPFQRRSE